MGGSVAGLAAAERCRRFASVDLFERQSYDDKRVNCGEAITEAELVPLAKTSENGFLNEVEGFAIEFYGEMKAEFRLARLMRGLLEETDDPDLRAAVADAVDGLGVAAVTRRPRRVYVRLLRRPRLLGRLLAVPGLRHRFREGYRDRWEFGRARVAAE